MKIYAPIRRVPLTNFGHLQPLDSSLQGLLPITLKWTSTEPFSESFFWSRDPLTAPKGTQRAVFGIVTCANIQAYPQKSPYIPVKEINPAREIDFRRKGSTDVARAGFWRKPKYIPLDMFAKDVRKYIRHRRELSEKEPRSLGRTLFVGQSSLNHYNYFHLWTESICDLFALQRSGVDFNDFDHILMSSIKFNWQSEIFQACGVPMEKIVSTASAAYFNIESLVTVQRVQTADIIADWCVAGMRGQANWHPPEVSANRKIFVTRGASAHRAIVNEQELVGLAQEYGYEAVDCGQLTVAQQQDLFASAASVIGPHGAGFANIAWCRPKTVFLEFLNPSWLVPCFHDLAKAQDLTYMNMLTTPINNGKAGDVKSVVDLTKFRQALDWVENQINSAALDGRS